jgi:hypothetical protein
MLSYHPEPLMHPEEQSVVEGEVREGVEHREVEDLCGDEGQWGRHSTTISSTTTMGFILLIVVLVAIEHTHKLVYRGVDMMRRRRRRRRRRIVIE